MSRLIIPGQQQPTISLEQKVDFLSQALEGMGQQLTNVNFLIEYLLQKMSVAAAEDSVEKLAPSNEEIQQFVQTRLKELKAEWERVQRQESLQLNFDE